MKIFMRLAITVQKMKFFIKDFFSKCDRIRSVLRIESHLLKRSLMENFIFCAWILKQLMIKTVTVIDDNNVNVIYKSNKSLFAQGFKQVKEWLMLELHEMIKVLHVVACPIVFILFYKRGWQGGVFNVMKNIIFWYF